MSQNEQDEYEPSAEELEALLDESKLTNEYIRQLEADFMPVTKLESTFDTAIVVDNLPVVGEDKREKLMRIIHKIYSQFGPIRENGFCLPTDSKGTTRGYAFIEFESPEVARLACEKTQGHKLDKQHIFAVNLYSDFEKLMAVPDEYVPPQVKDHEEGDNLRWWLQEPRGMEQYVIRQGEETEIYWNEILRKPEPIYKRSRWTDTYVRWSPRGSYMATLHVPGVILWGGEKWNKINRFQHPGVKLIDFSPCENFLITWSPQFLEHDNPKDPQCIIIWDIKKGTKLRGLPAGLLGPNGIHPWPNFFWTHDDKYFARLGKDAIMVYDSADMTLLDKKSIKIPGVRDFAWSPTEHVFACWVPEEGNSPARVILREIPSRKEIRNKTLFNVSDCKIHWQEQGNFLCVKVDRYTKKKKSTYTNFELFRIRENGMPSELLEVKDTILWFAWEPRGKRFAIIHGDGNLRYNVSIYRMGKNQLKHLVTLENRAANTLCWSPRGTFLVLAGMRNLNGTLEFYNTDELQTMGEGDHFMCTDLEWDPTGRYLCTSVSAWRQQMESGYTIWRFDGKIIHKIMKDRFFQFHWRPRPPSLLSDEQEVKIRKNLKEYTKRFAQLDAKEKKQFKSAHFAEKQRLIDEFAEWENRWRQAAEAERAQREKIPVRSSVKPDQYEEVVEKVEEVVEIIEEEL